MSEDEESTDNPFEELEDEVSDREGDPFRSLSADVSDEKDDESSTAGEDEDTEWVDEFGVGGPETDRRAGPTEPATADDTADAGDEEMDWESEQSAGASVGAGEAAGTDVFGDIGNREGDPFDEGGLFEERDTEGIDPDTVWEELAASDGEQETRTVEGRRFAEVSKHSYCEQCEHFSPPPDVACNHEGTNIVEFLDMETVRLVDCPIVAERLELEEE
jgi:hypothetical protein